MSLLRFGLAPIVLLSSAIGADSREIETLYEFRGPTEWVSVLSAVDFPDYGDRRYWHPAGPYRLAHEAPVDGTFGVAYQSQKAVIVEVFLRFHVDYLHAIIYYPDGRTPRFFQKQNLHTEGLGIAFRERLIDPMRGGRAPRSGVARASGDQFLDGPLIHA